MRARPGKRSIEAKIQILANIGPASRLIRAHSGPELVLGGPMLSQNMNFGGLSDTFFVSTSASDLFIEPWLPSWAPRLIYDWRESCAVCSGLNKNSPAEVRKKKPQILRQNMCLPDRSSCSVTKTLSLSFISIEIKGKDRERVSDTIYYDFNRNTASTHYSSIIL